MRALLLLPGLIGLALIHHGYTSSIEGPFWLGFLLVMSTVILSIFAIADALIFEPIFDNLEAKRLEKIRRDHEAELDINYESDLERRLRQS